MSQVCLVCQHPYAQSQLISPLSIASSYRVCDTCVLHSNPRHNFQQAQQQLKTAQPITDPELASPEIKIEPGDTLIQKAVDLLKKINSNYFIGVRKIVVDTGSSAYGFVEAGQGKDPAIIHINLPKIKAEVQSKLGGLSPEQQEKELVRQIALTVAHERAHSLSFKPGMGFQGGEQPAKAEANLMRGKLDQA